MTSGDFALAKWCVTLTRAGGGRVGAAAKTRVPGRLPRLMPCPVPAPPSVPSSPSRDQPAALRPLQRDHGNVATGNSLHKGGFSLMLNCRVRRIAGPQVMNPTHPPERGAKEALPRGPGPARPQLGCTVWLFAAGLHPCGAILVVKYFVYQHWAEVRLPWASVV